VTSTGGETMPTGTLSILPISANAQLPTITTTASGYDPNDVITTIPVSLSIQRSPSALSIVELTGADVQDGYSNSGSSNGNGGITTTALLSVKPLNGNQNISRNNSFNLSLNLQDPQQRSSMRSAGPTDTVDNSGTMPIPQRSGGLETGGVGGSSAPSTLAKHKPEQKTGEVYV